VFDIIFCIFEYHSVIFRKKCIEPNFRKERMQDGFGKKLVPRWGDKDLYMCNHKTMENCKADRIGWNGILCAYYSCDFLKVI
jgi:hypothetical protein